MANKRENKHAMTELEVLQHDIDIMIKSLKIKSLKITGFINEINESRLENCKKEILEEFSEAWLEEKDDQINDIYNDVSAVISAMKKN